MARLRLAVLASGEGSNLQAILDAARRGALDAEVVLVVSDKPGANALARAGAAGVRAIHVAPEAGDREAHERKVAAELDAAGATHVALAGYMRVLSPWFVRRYAGRLVNIHPSLLPAFRGRNAVRQALDAKVPVTGCTVHFVTEDVDAGPVILQASVPVRPGDDEAALAERIHEAEHRVYPQALQLLAEGRAAPPGARP